MKNSLLGSAVVCAVAISGAPARAQTHVHPASDSRRERYPVPAVRVDETPGLDGVLDDAVWKKAALTATCSSRRRSARSSNSRFRQFVVKMNYLLARWSGEFDVALHIARGELVEPGEKEAHPSTGSG
jgi:hypothetical protein